MRFPRTATFWPVLALFSLLASTAFSADAFAESRMVDRGSIFDALGEEFPELAAWQVGIALVRGAPPIVFWSWCAALGEEFPEGTGGSPHQEALGEEFPEKSNCVHAEALGEEFPE